MALQLGDTAPDFTQESTSGTIEFHKWAGDSWVLFFSHPKDYTPVCTTELGEIAKLKPELDKRNVKSIGISVDPLSDHKGWAKDIEDVKGTALNFPLLAGDDRKVAEAFDMIHPKADSNHTVRSVFVIDPNKKVRLILTYPASTGRNWAEVLRAIDSLQLTDNYKVATPVNWNDGDDVIIAPSLSTEEAKKLFPAGWDEQKPYLRVTKQPGK